jgi:hypothetical protein
VRCQNLVDSPLRAGVAGENKERNGERQTSAKTEGDITGDGSPRGQGPCENAYQHGDDDANADRDYEQNLLAAEGLRGGDVDQHPARDNAIRLGGRRGCRIVGHRVSQARESGERGL